MLVGRELYRALLREARQLPDSSATLHYQSLVRTSFRQPPAPESSATALKRVKDAQRARRLLRRLQAANDGYLHSLTRVLDTVYGLRGPTKHALLRPFVLSPTGQPHARHAFSPSLSALLTSPLAHTTRPPTPAQLRCPPSLPPRADPTSDAARLLGPLTPQRVRNIRLRYWTSQVAKLRAPLAVRVRGPDGALVDSAVAASAVLEAAGIKRVDVSGGWSRLQDLERRARVPDQHQPRAPRRLQSPEQRSAKGPTPSIRPPARVGPLRILEPSSKNTKWHLPKTLSNRLLRRRYALMLNAPVLVVAQREQDAVGFEVTKSKWGTGGAAKMGVMSEEDLWWLAQDDVPPSGKAQKGGGKSNRPRQ